MKTIFRISFLNSSGNGSLGNADLALDLPFTPSNGLEYEHTVWKGTRKCLSTSFNLDSQKFFVCLEHEKIGKDELENHIQRYRDLGWDVHT